MHLILHIVCRLKYSMISTINCVCGICQDHLPHVCVCRQLFGEKELLYICTLLLLLLLFAIRIHASFFFPFQIYEEDYNKDLVSMRNSYFLEARLWMFHKRALWIKNTSESDPRSYKVTVIFIVYTTC